MLTYTFKRLLQGVVTVWFIATATFFAMHAVPGNPLTKEKAVSAEIWEALQQRYGLDKPLLEQYWIYLKNMAMGDFGVSYAQENRQVNDIIAEHFRVSATLGILAVVFAAFSGILWGALTAMYRNRAPYSLPRGAVAADLVAAMVAQFRRAFDADLQARAAARGLGVREVVTLASLIRRETGLDEERAIVSAVYNNRLERRMLLQCDPTVIYALQLAGLYDGNLTRDNLRFDSPYNTYVHPGLPPGPIGAPNAADLRAAVEPADVPHLYFVSRNDGSHVFADTLREHNRNVREYQIEYFRRRER